MSNNTTEEDIMRMVMEDEVPGESELERLREEERVLREKVEQLKQEVVYILCIIGGSIYS